jgi:NADH dehydrogenase
MSEHSTQAQTVVIFGGSGFIGQPLSDLLAKKGFDVHIITRQDSPSFSSQSPFINFRTIPNFESDSLEKVTQDADIVINLIGILYEKPHCLFKTIHTELARKIALAAKKNAVTTFIQMSALGVSKESPSAYAQSKAYGEEAVLELFPNATLIRPSIVFGPKDSFFNLFASMARYSPFLPLIGGGLMKFQPVYVGDVVEALYKAMTDKTLQGEILELGGPQCYSFKELLALLLKVMNKKRILLPLPWAIAQLEASFLELFPKPLLTRDQLILLKKDNIIMSSDAKTLQSLGLSPKRVEDILPLYIHP